MGRKRMPRGRGIDSENVLSAAERKLDPRLRFLCSRAPAPPELVAETSGIAADAVPVTVPPEEVTVLVRGKGAWRKKLTELGWQPRSVSSDSGGIFNLTVPVTDLPALADLTEVDLIEAPRRLWPDLDLSRVNVKADVLHNTPPSGIRGAGTIVGVIDSGIDYTHRDFRHADGTSRILYLWDQHAPSTQGGPVPYGREYTQATLNQALQAPNPSTVVPHRDSDGHGTHVASIAAGNGGGSSYVGLAPEADLIVVAFRSRDGALGESPEAVDALDYFRQRAAGRPLAINMSQGMNGGGHVGETLLETAIDELCREPGVVFVKSAGNEQTWRIHAGGELAKGQTVALQVEVASNNRQQDSLEIWFDDQDQISVSVRPPGDEGSPAATRTNPLVQHATAANNQVRIDVDDDDDQTGDTRVFITLSRGTALFVQPGIWLVELKATKIKFGRYDAWIERTFRGTTGEQVRFAEASSDPTRTITIPGTARRAITVGSYVTRPEGGAALGEISHFSSRGPTRWNGAKPELVAPGEWIIAARGKDGIYPGNPDPQHTWLSGTSMAAPHVAGVAALILSQHPTFTCDQVKQVLMRSTRRDGAAAAAPDGTWGAGRLDAAEALQQAGIAQFPQIQQVQVAGQNITFQTDVECTVAVRFGRHLRRMALGRGEGSRASLILAMNHTISLAGLPSGDYFFEVLAYTADNWSASDDNGGSFYLLKV